MSQRYIVLGNGRRIGLGAYVIAWKKCLELPPQTPIGKGVSGWGQTASEALQDLRFGLHDRINHRVAGFGHGRKWGHDWQRETHQAADRLNHPRLVIDWLPPWLAARFPDRLRCNCI